MGIEEIASLLIIEQQKSHQMHTPLVVSLVCEPWTGTEVGVGWGWNSAALLINCPNLQLNMVDFYWKFPPEHPYHHANDFVGDSPQSFLDQMRAHALGITDWAGDRRRIYRMTSPEAALRISDGSQDFVFIDADHTYESVLYDLIAWYPKVREGGLFFGHDYGLWDVKPAVDDFAAGMALTVKTHNFGIWSIVKRYRKKKIF